MKTDQLTVLLVFAPLKLPKRPPSQIWDFTNDLASVTWYSIMFKFVPKHWPPIFICNGSGFFEEFESFSAVKLNAVWSNKPTTPVEFSKTAASS